MPMFVSLITHQLYELPVVSPELKFLIILAITLFAPLVLDRLRIPHILGLIMAGAIVGEHGFNILERDSGIVMSGTAGLLYIMFLAGLEIDINEFMKNRWRSIVFGLFTFVIPMGLGTLVGIYLLNFSLMTSLLLASMFASHTLLAYPIISKFGLKRNRAVTITIGGTVIAETAALLVLAVIVGMTGGVVDARFWLTMTAKLLTFGVAIFVIFPIVARYFLKRCREGLTQYIFVLFMLFLGSIFAQAAGVEGIIGALFTGLALNRLIPNNSALMNRIEFVGNAIFIPFFLIGVGMLIDFRVFISDLNTLYTALIMTAAALFTKYIAAYITQKSFGYSSDEKLVIFGLSGARAAATLAVVLVGYNVILGVDEAGEPIRLLNSTVLNGTIVMIFVTCSVASIAAQRGAYRLSMNESIDSTAGEDDTDMSRLLLPINSLDGIDELLAFTNFMAPPRCAVTVAAIVSDAKDEVQQVAASRRIFDKALHSASASDMAVETLLRYDTSYSNGISNIIRENSVSDLIINIDTDKELSQKVISKIVDGSAHSSSVTTFMYRANQPIHTIRRHLIVIPPSAELEMGFRAWLIRIATMLRATGATATVYASKQTLRIIKRLNATNGLPVQKHEFVRYSDMLIISRDLKKDDGLIFVMGKRLSPSYDECMESVPHYINSYFQGHNYIMIFPYQTGASKGDLDGMTNVASMSAVAKIEEVIGNVIGVVKKRPFEDEDEDDDYSDESSNDGGDRKIEDGHDGHYGADGHDNMNKEA